MRPSRGLAIASAVMFAVAVHWDSWLWFWLSGAYASTAVSQLLKEDFNARRRRP